MNAKNAELSIFQSMYYVDKHHSRYQMPLLHRNMSVSKAPLPLFWTGKNSCCPQVARGSLTGSYTETPLDCIYECIVFDLKELLHAVPHTKLYVDAF